jgi:hypothetical protein
MLIAMHFCDERGWWFAPKIILTLMIFSSVFWGFNQHRVSSGKKTEQIRNEKYLVKNVRKNL